MSNKEAQNQRIKKKAIQMKLKYQSDRYSAALKKKEQRRRAADAKSCKVGVDNQKEKRKIKMVSRST